MGGSEQRPVGSGEQGSLGDGGQTHVAIYVHMGLHTHHAKRRSIYHIRHWPKVVGEEIFVSGFLEAVKGDRWIRYPSAFEM
jgi:hypothetical protein